MQPPKLPQLNIRGLRYEKRKIHVSSEEQVLPLKYLPLAWVAVLLTGLTKITVAMNVNLHDLAKLLNLTSAWSLSLIIYSAYQLIVVLLLVYLLKRVGIAARNIGFKRTSKKILCFRSNTCSNVTAYLGILRFRSKSAWIIHVVV